MYAESPVRSATERGRNRTRGPNRRRDLSDVALLAVALVWGSSYLATKDVVSTTSMFGYLTIRFAIATAVLTLLVAPRLAGLTRYEIGYGASYGMILSVVFVAETAGVTRTSASHAGLIISLTIIFTPLLDQFVRRSRIPAAFYAAATVAITGVAMLAQSSGAGSSTRGDLYILFAALARAVHVTVIATSARSSSQAPAQRASRASVQRAQASSQRPQLNLSRLTVVQLCTATLVFATISVITGHGPVEVARTMSAHDWVLTGYLALICTVFAFGVQMWAARRSSAARVSLLLGTEPLWAAIIGVWLGADALTPSRVIGAALILVGTNWGRVAGRAITLAPKAAAPKAGAH